MTELASEVECTREVLERAEKITLQELLTALAINCYQEGFTKNEVRQIIDSCLDALLGKSSLGYLLGRPREDLAEVARELTVVVEPASKRV